MAIILHYINSKQICQKHPKESQVATEDFCKRLREARSRLKARHLRIRPPKHRGKTFLMIAKKPSLVIQKKALNS